MTPHYISQFALPNGRHVEACDMTVWRIWESNPSEFLLARQVSTPCRPIPHMYQGTVCSNSKNGESNTKVVAVCALFQHKKYKTNRNAGVANSLITQTQPRLHSELYWRLSWIFLFSSRQAMFLSRRPLLYMRCHRLSQG